MIYTDVYLLNSIQIKVNNYFIVTLYYSSLIQSNYSFLTDFWFIYIQSILKLSIFKGFTNICIKHKV